MACTKETVKRNGLNIWSTGSEDGSTPSFDIIAVQGLGAHPFYTWVGKSSSKTELKSSKSRHLLHRIHKWSHSDEDTSSKEAEIMWLRDLLPGKFPNARIASYSYESGWDRKEETNLRRCGDQLLEVLLQHRQSPQDAQRPILLIGHSLGGLVIQQALVSAVHRHECLDLRQAVAGIIFLGVPFDGSDIAQYGEWIAQAVGGDDKLLRELRRNSEQLVNLSVDFWYSYQTWDIICYYENEDSNYGPWKVQTVQKQSAAIRGKRMIYLQTDHSGLNKFSGINDENFALLLPEIERIVRNGPKIVSDRYHGIATKLSVLPVWLVPFERNQNFIGRVDQFEKIESCLSFESHFTKLALMGLGGVGKTQVALELAYRVRDQNPEVSVFWLSATSTESIEQTFIKIGDQLQIPGISDKNANAKELVKQYLSRENTGPWLMIFDNVDDFDMWFNRDESNQELCLIDYIPRNDKGCVVFTTRTREVAVTFASTNVVEVSHMDEEVATQLLRKLLVDQEILSDCQNTQELLRQLTYLPLAIAQAAAYINIHNISVLDYLSLLEDTEENVVEVLSEEFEDDWRDHKHQKNPIATTWLVSIKQIQDRDPLAADYLWFMSCLSPKDISQSILPPAPSKHKELKAIAILKSYSFISQRNRSDTFDIHRLVHLVTRSWLRQKNLISTWTEIVLARLADLLISVYQNRVIWSTYLPHIDYILQSNPSNEESKFRLQVAALYGGCLFENGRFHEAEELLVRVIETSKRVLGQEDPSVLSCMGNLAMTYSDQGRWKEAEELEVQVIEISKRVLGPEHPNTLSCMGFLAMIYLNQGRLKEAEELQVQVLEISKRELGQKHLDTLEYTNNLAIICLDQGRWKEAEALQVQVVEEFKRILGQEHLDTANSMSTLAEIYSQQGRWVEAEELFAQEGEICKRLLGKEHLSTLRSMTNLALAYLHQDRWKEAEELQGQALEMSKRVLGQEHPDTLNDILNLALVYQKQGRLKEAEELQVPVMEVCKRVLGQEHPRTLESIGNLGSTYQKQGRWKEAEELQVQVLETSKKVLGEKHPETLNCIANLAVTMKSQGRNEDAVMLMDQCVNLREMTLGVEHPDTKESLNTLREWQLEGPST